MKRLYHLLFFLLSFGTYALNAVVSWAVLGADYYDQRARQSAIQAIATVTKVEIVGNSEHFMTKRVRFRLEKAFTKGVPDEFTGFCTSFDASQHQLIIGGRIHFYPYVNQRVFVTITRDNGDITSFTSMTPELEKELECNGIKNIKFMGSAWIKSNYQYNRGSKYPGLHNKR